MLLEPAGCTADPGALQVRNAWPSVGNARVPTKRNESSAQRVFAPRGENGCNYGNERHARGEQGFARSDLSILNTSAFLSSDKSIYTIPCIAFSFHGPKWFGDDPGVSALGSRAWRLMVERIRLLSSPG